MVLNRKEKRKKSNSEKRKKNVPLGYVDLFHMEIYQRLALVCDGEINIFASLT